MKTIIKLSLIALIVLLVSACGFRKHEIAAINEATVQSIIAMNTPACNPNIADCGLITGGY